MRRKGLFCVWCGGPAEKMAGHADLYACVRRSCTVLTFEARQVIKTLEEYP